MTEERRYTPEEIDRIFRLAVEEGSERRMEARAHGLTLPELKEVGREVGISPERIERAAVQVETRGGVRRTLGLPMTVSHTAALPRLLTDAEWHAVVADLRETFRATGKLQGDGGLRGWTNGNLHAFLEPDASRARLRMGSTKGSARTLLSFGGGVLGLSAVMGAFTLFGADVPVASAGSFFATGLALIVMGTVSLPTWSRTRLRQMEEVARRALERLGQEGPEPDA